MIALMMAASLMAAPQPLSYNPVPVNDRDAIGFSGEEVACKALIAQGLAFSLGSKEMPKRITVETQVGQLTCWLDGTPPHWDVTRRIGK